MGNHRSETIHVRILGVPLRAVNMDMGRAVELSADTMKRTHSEGVRVGVRRQ
jgi:hypothetical protein